MQTSSILLPIYCLYNDNNFTFPYRRDKLVIVLPNQVAGQQVMSGSSRNVVSLFVVLVIIAVAIGFTCVRAFFKKLVKPSSFSVPELFFNSFGLSLGTVSKWKSNNMAESLLILTMSVFALLCSLILSGYLFQQFTKIIYTSSIDTIAELKRTKITLLVDRAVVNWVADLFNE